MESFLFFYELNLGVEESGVTYATCIIVSDLMWRLLLNAHSFIQNNCVH